jgi:hypothetical protein
MNICTYMIFFKIFLNFLFWVTATFLFDGRLGRLITTISFLFNTAASSENNTKILSRRGHFYEKEELHHFSLRYFFSNNSYRAVKRKMIRKSSKVYPSLSEDNYDQKKATTTTEQVNLKSWEIFQRNNLILYY